MMKILLLFSVILSMAHNLHLKCEPSFGCKQMVYVTQLCPTELSRMSKGLFNLFLKEKLMSIFLLLFISIYMLIFVDLKIYGWMN